uniref:Rubicon Homology domain-containing protein n=1 Tax=Parascaris equorum TaxID=6256 RepID=A0A914R8G2_PAREQ
MENGWHKSALLENMHLYLSEMLIAAIEQMKWKRESEAILAEVIYYTHNDSNVSINESSDRRLFPSIDFDIDERRTGGSVFYTSLDDSESPPKRDTLYRQTLFREEAAGREDESSCEGSAEAIASSLLRHFSSMRPTEMASDIDYFLCRATRREFPVSDIAQRFLMDNRSQPVINASAIRILRTKLVHLWPFIRMCAITERTVTKYGNSNYAEFKKMFIDQCCSRAFICELCDRRDEVLFPFQLDRAYRCEQCGSLSHMRCAARRFKSSLPCPKCVRIAANL